MGPNRGGFENRPFQTSFVGESHERVARDLEHQTRGKRPQRVHVKEFQLPVEPQRNPFFASRAARLPLLLAYSLTGISVPEAKPDEDFTDSQNNLNQSDGFKLVNIRSWPVFFTIRVSGRQRD